ncbi:MAG: flagellar M-ring protein FliF [Desulfobacteraceae bacterium]|nr:flagellar M-ring protein FliF [Desulfobacteraceae bacterium]
MAQIGSEFFNQLKGILQSMTAGKLISLGVLVIGSIVAMITIVTWSSKPDYMPLYTHLSPNDAGQVVAQLREEKIQYKLSHDGGTILIPRDRVYEVRLNMAAEGLPKGGSMGFEVFDNTKLGMTEFVQNINYQRALQGELSRTIDGLEEVQSSRVHIVIPEKSLFIEQEEEASASVILKLKHGRWISQEQIQGIIHLVSSSVPRLTPDNVTIVDHNGNLLTEDKNAPISAKLSNDQLEFQLRKEKALEKQVSTMLEKVLGKDKSIVRVACELDFVQQEKTEETYLPENQVVRSEQVSTEVASQVKGSPAGVPGMAANITAGAKANTEQTTPTGYEKRDNTRNFEIGKRTSHQVLPTGKLMRLSVAVIVDGTYETITKGKGKNKQEEIQYVSRTAEEMATLESIVKRTVNFDDTRGDMVKVANMPFSTEKIIPELSGTDPSLFDRLKEYASLIKYIIAAVFVLFTFNYVVRPLVLWLTDTSWEDVELFQQLPRSLAEIEKQYSLEDSGKEYVNQAAQLITTKQEDSAKLMQQWLNES